MNIATVVEGPTDRIVLEAVLDILLPGDPMDHRYFPLQPASPPGETGTGWKGVRRWCRQRRMAGSNLDTIISGDTGPPLDLLVIHVDADVVREDDLQEDADDPVSEVEQPCPPVGPTVNRIRQVIKYWLGRNSLPQQVVLAIPAQDTESWTFVALFPEDDLCTREDYECFGSGRDHPGYLLTLSEYGKLLRRSSGRIKKPRRKYRGVASRIAESWERVREVCTQAEEFSQNVSDVIAG